MRASMTYENTDVCEKFFTKTSSYRPDISIGFMGDSRDFPFENDLKNWEHYIIAYFKHMGVVF